MEEALQCRSLMAQECWCQSKSRQGEEVEESQLKLRSQMVLADSSKFRLQLSLVMEEQFRLELSFQMVWASSSKFQLQLSLVLAWEGSSK
jgi:hypothetical protein